MARLGELAIRNYELKNKTLSENIAKAIAISPFAIYEPNLESYIGVMHALFELEDNYGMTLVSALGATCMAFKHQNAPRLSGRFSDWAKENQELKNGEITQEYAK